MKLKEKADRLVPEMRAKMIAHTPEDQLKVQMLVSLFKLHVSQFATELDWGSVAVGLLAHAMMDGTQESAAVVGSVLLAFNDNVEGFEDIVKGFNDDDPSDGSVSGTA